MITKETVDSAISYGTAGGSVALGVLVEVSHYAQAIAIILGCIIAAVRLTTDAVKLYRTWKNKE